MDIDSSPTAPPESRTFRTVSVLLLAGFAAIAAWLALRSPSVSREPAGVWDYIRDRVVEGDGEAVWRMTLPEARPKFIEFVRMNAEAPESDARATEWRRKTGLSIQDLKTLPPEKIMAREYLASVDRIRGSRVYRTDTWPDDRALIRVSLKDGGEAHFVVRRKEGAWRIEVLIPMVTADGNYIPYAGATPIQVPNPK